MTEVVQTVGATGVMSWPISGARASFEVVILLQASTALRTDKVRTQCGASRISGRV